MVDLVPIDQTAVDGFQSLGEFDFAAGGGQLIHLGDNTGEAGSLNVQLVFDNVRLTRLDLPDPDPDPDPDPNEGTPGGLIRGGCSTTPGSTNNVAALFALFGLTLFLRRRVR